MSYDSSDATDIDGRTSVRDSPFGCVSAFRMPFLSRAIFSLVPFLPSCHLFPRAISLSPGPFPESRSPVLRRKRSGSLPVFLCEKKTHFFAKRNRRSAKDLSDFLPREESTRSTDSTERQYCTDSTVGAAVSTAIKKHQNIPYF